MRIWEFGNALWVVWELARNYFFGELNSTNIHSAFVMRLPELAHHRVRGGGCV